MIKKIAFIFALMLATLACKQTDSTVLDLAGSWTYKLDSLEVGEAEKWYNADFSQNIQLPGALRDYNIGDEPTLQTNWTGSIYDSSWYFNPAMEKYRQAGDVKFPFWLTPVKHYKGMAWYQREIEIPENWEGKEVVFMLERPHWQTKVWIDSVFIGSDNSLSVPHRFRFNTSDIHPGKHTLTVLVDNEIRDIDPGINSHSISDHTQGNWNGMIGDMFMELSSSDFIQRIKLTPNVKHKKLVAEIHVSPHSTLWPDKLKIDISGVNHAHTLSNLTFPVQTKESVISVEISMGDEMKTWSEFSPAYYQFSVQTMHGETVLDNKTEVFGMRQFTLDSLHFAINDTTVFLRGTTECSVFPLTGYPPTTPAEWDSIFAVCKNFGLNHMRFHSYCPPEAAFVAADRAGIYLQIEGPSWAKYSTNLGYGKPIDQYLMDETKRILDEYGNHPSFVMMAYGNEPSGRYVGYLENWVDHFRQYDSRILYTGASTGGSWHTIENSDFIVRAPPRGLSWKSREPESEFDYRNKTEGQNKPYVTFEMGQWCVYPNFKEIEKYTGSLKAKNFELFHEDLHDKGMADMAEKFLMASGKLQASCYKQEIEATLRTPNLAGFQLLSLNDFSGQGTALVGVLDAFWHEKGYVSGSEFSRFCNAVVPLARFPKFVYQNGEVLNAELEIANYSGKAISSPVRYTIKNEAGEVLSKAELKGKTLPSGKATGVGMLSYIPVSSQKARKLILEVEVDGYSNAWNFWVFPKEEQMPSTQVYVCKTLDARAEKILNDGGKVLLLAAGTVENGKEVEHYQTPVFWNTSWFRMRPPHTTGLLINDAHPVFADFPTDYYTDHQWWEVSNRAQCMNLELFPDGFSPIVQPIDTWFLNRKLAMMLEANVGKGKLMVCSMDVASDLPNRPVATRLYNSMVEYMESEQFMPKSAVDMATVKELFEIKERPVWNSYVNENP